MPLHPLTDDDPELIGGHRLLARLGSGGMGTVYLARMPSGRAVALKAAHPALAADLEFVTRFSRETETVRALGALPHTPPFAGAGTDDDGRPWLATAYVVGPSLAEAVTAHGPWPEASLRSLGARLATGLAALHRAGVVHRDLKPSNILLMPAGPLLVDFGIAQAIGTDDRTGSAPGTPAYMAPEQLIPDREVGPPCDVFALACVLTYTACGLPPFGEGAPGEVLYRVTHQEPELTAVPDALRPLLADCLAKEPERRPTAGRRRPTHRRRGLVRGPAARRRPRRHRRPHRAHRTRPAAPHTPAAAPPDAPTAAHRRRRRGPRGRGRCGGGDAAGRGAAHRRHARAVPFPVPE
ncbi:serine/threonine-protein kinase [Streptomyces sp. NPDC050211]|uniref:serine/threonine-protein kinase n=1 Tax=Streptomyces sp. NPDC050211 TaxID=3154932 RepID=UPI0034182FE4